MGITRRHGGVAAAVLATALTVVGCTTTTEGGDGETAPQELTYVPAFFPVSLDPHNFPAEEGTQVAAQQTLETLVTYNDGEAQPLLAESWEYSDDELTLTFQLRDDVTFSDGTPFTAEDAKASLDRLIELDKALAPLFAAVTETRADDDHTFSIVTSEPLGTLLASMSLVFIGQAGAMGEDSYWRAPVGTGPFIVDDYVADDHVTYSRNDDYWGEAAQLDTLEMVSMPEVAARITALGTGEVDVISSIPPDQVAGVQDQDGVEFIQDAGYLYYFIWFNHNEEPFDDQRVRQAMWHAVDVEGIVSDLYGEGATAATAPIPQAAFGAADNGLYEHDPERARELLADAGFPDGFETSMQWPREGGPNIRSLGQAFISAWAEVGIDVEPLEKERASWLEDFGSMNWDLNLQTNTTATGDADFTLNRLYTCEADRLGYCNPELDDLLAQARASLDPDERSELYDQANEIMWEEAPGIFPADIQNNLAYGSQVRGLELPPNNRPYFSTVSIE
ncbi:ABC transporter substrate-binding protein [Ruania alba]|uniref:Peptide/nickel transport system substrate-binding protein n=1 Tax=Ruania alba TaxID=648782 RepID=A0A1H5HRE0_9MICO|nr:ABC transporter substrate-binding protein [Ruania alba]SEE30475.1 peptide/nickel transport system substrate-binding protein [Ruania alba]